VVPRIFPGDNTTSALVPLLSDRARFPDWSAHLATVADDGTLRQAVVKRATVARHPGNGCGWRVAEAGRTVRLPRGTFAWPWWVRIGYLSSSASPLRVTAGGDEVTAEVEPGLGTLFVRVDGAFDSVRLDGLEPGASLCVDRVEVGSIVPGSRL
jgi:hypothetical protein